MDIVIVFLYLERIEIRYQTLIIHVTKWKFYWLHQNSIDIQIYWWSDYNFYLYEKKY